MGKESRTAQKLREDARDCQYIPIPAEIRKQFKQDFAHFRSTLLAMPFTKRLQFCIGVMRGTV